MGIVGTGRIASLYENDPKAKKYYPSLTHAGAFSRHPKTEITCACDSNVSRLRDFGRKWRVVALYPDYREMLRQENIDILSVCTQHDVHRKIIAAAAGNVALIFCEKPMGRHLKEAREIVDLCRRRGSRLAVNLYRLFDPAHRETGRLLRSGLIGSVQRVNCFYGKGLRNMGTHIISLLLSYFGPIASVNTLALDSLGDGGGLTADFLARFAAGFPCVVQGCDFRNYRIFEIDILGSYGRILLNREGFGFQFYRAVPNRAETGAQELSVYKSPVRATVGRALDYAVQELVDCVGTGREPLSSGREYLKTEEVIEAVYQSAHRRKPVAVGGAA